jgi:hypothetical protein
MRVMNQERKGKIRAELLAKSFVMMPFGQMGPSMNDDILQALRGFFGQFEIPDSTHRHVTTPQGVFIF